MTTQEIDSIKYRLGIAQLMGPLKDAAGDTEGASLTQFYAHDVAKLLAAIEAAPAASSPIVESGPASTWVIVCLKQGRGLPYWRPEQAGYTDSIVDAGKYSYDEAAGIVSTCKGDTEKYCVDDPALYALITNENLARGKEIKLWLENIELRTKLAAAASIEGGGPLEELLTAYADLAATHDDALPLTAEADENGLIQFYLHSGVPVEADQALADLVAAACNAAGAGFLADLRAENAKEGAAPLLVDAVAAPAGWISVDERLPEEGRKVWVAVKERHHHRFGGAVVMRAYTAGKPGMVEQSFADNDAENIAVESVSHWMYATVPAAPADENR